MARLMREHGLLSPRRVRQGAGSSHGGRVTSDAPGVMWGSDGTRVLTAEEGMCFRLRRRRPLQLRGGGRPRLQAGRSLCRAAARVAGAAGAVRRRDAGRRARTEPFAWTTAREYVSGHFRNQVRFCGVAASYSFIERPQNNGVAERFFKTLKEQIVYGRVYRTVAELRTAVAAFVDLYNEQWLPEKNGFLSPAVMHEAWYAGKVAA